MIKTFFVILSMLSFVGCSNSQVESQKDQLQRLLKLSEQKSQLQLKQNEEKEKDIQEIAQHTENNKQDNTEDEKNFPIKKKTLMQGNPTDKLSSMKCSVLPNKWILYKNNLPIIETQMKNYYCKNIIYSN